MKKIPIPQISYFRSTGFMEFYSFYNSTVACLFNFADGGHYPATPYHRMYRYNSFKFVSNLVSQSMFVTQRKSLPDPNFWETLRINNLLVRSKVLPQRYYFCTYQYGNVYYNACMHAYVHY